MSEEKPPIVIGVLLVTVLVVSGCTTIYELGEEFCEEIGYNHFERGGILDHADGQCWNVSADGNITKVVDVMYTNGEMYYREK